MGRKLVDRTGNVYGRLTALNLAGRDEHNKFIWRCICSCGKYVDVMGNKLANGTKRSCGCLRSEHARSATIDHAGKNIRSVRIEHRVIEQIEYKYCSNCQKWKNISDFNRERGTWDGLRKACRIHWGEWKEKNKDYYVERGKNNKEHINLLRKNRYWNNINYRLGNILGARMRLALNGKSKSAKTLELLGCSIKQLKHHLENQFDENMNWENYGEYWQIDHIRPCASFNLSKPEEQKRCFHYSNLQPLEKSLNIIKDSIYNGHKYSYKDTGD